MSRLDSLRAWGLCMMLACAAAHAAGSPPIDAAWRQHDLERMARSFKDPAGLRQDMQRELDAAHAAGDLAREIQSAADYMQGVALPSPPEIRARNEKLIEAALAHYKDEYAAPLFELLYAELGEADVSSATAAPRLAKLEELSNKLGDPGRAALVEMIRANQLMDLGKLAEAYQALSMAENLAANDFRKAEVLLARAYSTIFHGADITTARDSAMADLERAMALVDPEQYPVLGAMAVNARGRVWANSGEWPQAIKDYQLALKYAQVIGGHATLRIRLGLVDTLVNVGRTQEAVRTLRDLTPGEIEGAADEMGVALSNIRAYTALGDPEALAAGRQWLDKANRYLEWSKGATPYLIPKYHKLASALYKRSGEYEKALSEAEAGFAASQDLANKANEAARLELQTKLDVAAKDSENLQLRSAAQATEERRIRWVLAFVASAVGVLIVAAALAVTIRQKRRLADVSSQLARRNVQLEELSRARIQLLAAACHDLRQPAHALGMLAELGFDAVGQADTMRSWLHGIQRCSVTLSDMLGELMDMSRLDGGHYTPSVEPLALDELLHDVRLQYGELARRKGLSLDAPPCGLYVRSDRHLFRRIVFNVVSNAVKYTRQGKVSVLAQAEGGEVVLRVVDTGPGIPPERVEDIFNDYVRLEADRAVEGLGIGLSIVKQAADLLGHRLELNSTLGEGTTIVLRAAMAEAQHAEASIDAEPAAEVGLIALLENDDDVRLAMAAVLRRHGYQVLDSESIDGLRETLARETGDKPLRLLITDLHLNGGADGLDAVRSVREWPGCAQLPALLLTGDLDAGIATRAAAQSVFVGHKPMQPRQLLVTVKLLLQSSNSMWPQTASAGVSVGG